MRSVPQTLPSVRGNKLKRLQPTIALIKRTATATSAAGIRVAHFEAFSRQAIVEIDDAVFEVS
jgi:uncharacterized phage protein gp47/JayE